LIPGTKKSVISIRDITEIKSTEKALRDSEAIYQQLEAQLPDFVIIHEGETIVFVNDEGARLMGKTPEQIIGTSVLSYAAPAYHELIKKNTMLRYKGIAVEPYEIEIIAPSGEQRWVVVRATRIPNRESPSTLTVLTDITGRRQAEAALLESETKYRTIIENMQDLFYRTDLEGTITMVSPAGIRISGYNSPEDLIGRNISDGIYADIKEREQFLAVLKEKGIVNDYPLSLIAGDGTVRYVTASSHFYYDADGKVQGIEGILHDVTGWKLAEKALLQANQKLHLLSGITRHDINNKLTVLKGYLALLEEKLPDPALNEYFLKTKTAAEQISSMIQFMKEYEEIGVAEPVWHDIRTLAHTAAKEIPPGQIKMKNDLPAGMEVFADPLIAKVFFNIVDNSVRYGGKDTTIRFFVENSNEDKIIVCEDDGAGVATPDKEKIFERGFGKNTGLGLALSREILHITGITIRETGEPGKGARFEITVPKGIYRVTGGN
jgi:PAS domain S-box-containing protein